MFRFHDVLYALVSVSLLSVSVPSKSFAEPKVRVVGLQVIREAVGEGMKARHPFNAQSTGTQLALLVESDIPIIKLDVDNSTLDTFIDNTQQSLLTSKADESHGFGHQEGFGPFPAVSETLGMVTIRGAGFPAKGASRIGAKGTLVVVVGEETEAVKSQPFPLAEGEEFTVGEMKLTVKQIGESSFGDGGLEMTFETSDKGMSAVAEIRFLDESDNALKSESAGSGTFGFGGKAVTHSRSFRFESPPEGNVIVEFKIWTDMEEKKVPFAVAAGIGE